MTNMPDRVSRDVVVIGGCGHVGLPLAIARESTAITFTSTTVPAAFTGTVGVKPTYGAVSRYGLVALAGSLPPELTPGGPERARHFQQLHLPAGQIGSRLGEMLLRRELLLIGSGCGRALARETFAHELLALVGLHALRLGVARGFGKAVAWQAGSDM